MRNIYVIDGTGYMAPSQINPLYEALGLYCFASAEAVDTFCDQLDASPAQRINKYNFTKDSVGSYGVQIHTDSGFLTILQDDASVGGLEAMGMEQWKIAQGVVQRSSNMIVDCLLCIWTKI